MKLRQPTSDFQRRKWSTKDLNISIGTIVEHVRFGKGSVIRIEGSGADTKAEINFSKYYEILDLYKGRLTYMHLLSNFDHQKSCLILFLFWCFVLYCGKISRDRFLI